MPASNENPGIIKFTVQTKYERMQGPELAGLTLTIIQVTMFKVTEDVSCCTDKCMQALEALYFLRDVVQTFFVNFSIKFNIVLNFQLLT